MPLPNKTQTLTLSAIAAAVVVTAAVHWLYPEWESDQQGGIWWKMVTITVTVLSGGFALFEPRLPWRLPMVMAFSFYFLGLFFIFRDWGTLLPFELIFTAVVALPGVVTAYAVGALAARSSRSDRL
jgi:hypothetical protein